MQFAVEELNCTINLFSVRQGDGLIIIMVTLNLKQREPEA